MLKNDPFFAHILILSTRALIRILILAACLLPVASLTAWAAPDTWTARAAAPAVVNGGAALVYPGSGDTIYAFRGNNSTAFWGYNTKNNTWTTLAVTPATVWDGGALVHPGSGDTIYALGANTSTNFWGYNTKNNTWTTLAGAPATVDYGGALVYPGTGDTIYAFRGGTTTTFWGYNFKNDTWATLASAPATVGGGGALVYPGTGDTIYAFGGGTTTNFWGYNFKNNTWDTRTAAPAAVFGGGALVYPGTGDTIFAFRGNNNTTFWGYNIQNNVWATRPAVPASVWDGGALVYPGSGDTVYAFGGNGTTDFWGYTVPFYSGPNWYVNDLSTAGDTFTSAVGDTTGDGSSGRPFLTITKALQKAKPGDTIYIDAGLYAETVVINMNNITLIGKDSASTVIDPPGASSTPGLYGILGQNATGLTIKNIGVTGAYSGIRLDNVDFSTISNDSSGSNDRHGIELVNGSDTNTITLCDLSRNVTGSGFGIEFNASNFNTISNSVLNFNGQYGVYTQSTANNNTVLGNTVNSNSSYGMFLLNSARLVIKNNTVLSNASQGIRLNNGSNCVITGNTVRSNSEGIVVAGPSAIVTYNIISFNTTHGLWVINGSGLYAAHNTIADNTQYQVYFDPLGPSNSVVEKNNFKGATANPDSIVWNRSDTTQTVTRNWWGTTSESAIRSKIVDTATSLKVVFKPFRLGIVDTAQNADTTAPGLLANVTIDTSVPSQIKLTWIKPTINEETNGGSLGLGDISIYRLVNQPDTTNWYPAEYKVILVGTNDTFFIDTNVVPGSTYYYRLTSSDTGNDTAPPYVNESFFTDTVFAQPQAPPPPAPKTWFVNNLDTVGDFFATAVGSDSNLGDSPASPFLTIMKAFQTAKAGDTIKIDAGYYAETTVIDTDNLTIIGADSRVTTIDPPGGNISGIAIKVLSGRKGITIRDLGITNAYDAIEFNSVTNSLIYGDSFGNMGSHAINFMGNCDTNIIRRNAINDSCANRAIDMTSSCVNNIIDTNLIRKSVLDGLGLLGNKNFVVFNVFSSNNNYGMNIIGSSNEITNNTVKDNGFDGIYVNGGDNNTIIGNTVDSNAYSGIKFGSAADSNNVRKNLVMKNLMHGVEFGSCERNTLTENAIDSNNISGVNLGSSSSRIFVAYNSILGNNDAGIKIDFADTSAVIGNTIANSDTGIFFSSGFSPFFSITKNNFINIRGNNVYNPGGYQADLTRNWWGTADEGAISAKFSDTLNAFRPYRFGPVDSGPTADTTAPAAPTGVSLDTSVGGQIRVSWVNPSLNEETNGGSVSFAGLNIFRTVNLADTNNWHNALFLVKQTNSSDTNWIDTNVAGGSTYYYRLTSKDTAVMFNESFFTDTKFAALASGNPAGLLQIIELPNIISPDVLAGETMILRVTDTGANANSTVAETVTVRLKNMTTNEQETATLTEKDTDDAVFEVNYRFSSNSSDSASASAGSRMYVVAGDTVRFDYTDPTDAADTELVLLVTETILDFNATPADTQILQGDTAVVLAFKVSNFQPKDNASITDTILTITVTRVLGADTYLVDSGAVKLWEDTGTIGLFQPYVIDVLRASGDLTQGVCTLTLPISPEAAAWIGPQDTRAFFVTFQIYDTALSGETLDAKIAVNAASHTLGGKLPDIDVNSTGVLPILPKTYNGPVWYVNDTNSAGNFFTSALGNDLNLGSSFSPFRTIAKVMSKARAGDTIKIDPGLYTETFVIDTENLTVIGRDSNSTVFDPPGDSGISTNYGIHIKNSCTNLILRDIGVLGAYVGIRVEGAKFAQILSDSVSYNGSVGIQVLTGADSGTYTNNWVTDNGGKGIYNEAHANTFKFNTVTRNNNEGIYIITGTNSTLESNRVEANSGNGLHIQGSSFNNIRANVFKANLVSGAYIFSGPVGLMFSSNLFSNNLSYGVHDQSGNSGMYVQNTFDSNGLYQIWASSVDTIFIKNNILTSPSNPDSGVTGLLSTTLYTFTRNWWGTTDEAAIAKKFPAGFAFDSVQILPYRVTVVDTAAGADTTAPDKAGNVTLDTTVANQIKISWTIPAANEETNGGSVGFNGLNIFRTVNTPDTNNWHNTALLVKQTNSSETFWIDTTVTGGNTYYYRLTSKDAAPMFNESFFTDTKGAQPSGTANPPGELSIILVGSPGLAQDIAPGETIFIQVNDTGVNLNPVVAETLTVRIKNLATNEQETVTLTEKDTNNAMFTLNFRFSGLSSDIGHGDGRMFVQATDTIRLDYTDPGDGADNDSVQVFTVTVLEGEPKPADTQIKQGDTAVILAFIAYNPAPIDIFSPTDTVTVVQVTRLLGADTYVKPAGVRLWRDTGVIGQFQPGIDIFLDSGTFIAGVATLNNLPLAHRVFNPGDTKDFLVTLTLEDTAPLNDTIDAKISIGGFSHALGGNLPDTDMNSAGALPIKPGNPNVFVLVEEDSILLPASYSGPSGDSIPGATLQYVVRYDNDGADTAQNFILNFRIPVNTQLVDTPTVIAHNGASPFVTILDVSDSPSVPGPNAQKIRVSFTGGVGPNNGDAIGMVDASSADVDAGIVKYKVYIK